MLNHRLSGIKLIFFGLIMFFVWTLNLSFVYATQFTSPVTIGTLISADGVKFSSKQELQSSKENYYYDYGGKSGIVRYYTKNTTGAQARFGSNENLNNTVSVGVGQYNEIYEVVGDDNQQIFIIVQSCKCYGGPTIKILGKNRDGRYVKHYDYNDFKNAYIGESPDIGVMGYKTAFFSRADELIITCQGLKTTWRYHLIWNDALEQFDIKFERISAGA